MDSSCSLLLVSDFAKYKSAPAKNRTPSPYLRSTRPLLGAAFLSERVSDWRRRWCGCHVGNGNQATRDATKTTLSRGNRRLGTRRRSRINTFGRRAKGHQTHLHWFSHFNFFTLSHFSSTTGPRMSVPAPVQSLQAQPLVGVQTCWKNVLSSTLGSTGWGY